MMGSPMPGSPALSVSSDASSDVSLGLSVDGSSASASPHASESPHASSVLQFPSSRCLDGTHSVLFSKAPNAGPLQSVGISHPSLVLSTALQHCLKGPSGSAATNVAIGKAVLLLQHCLH
jgi:hypothetical protein